MEMLVRRKLAMASRVRDFCRAHTSTSEGYVQAVAKLEERLARAEALAAQQDTGYLTKRASTKAKRELRRVIRENHLRHLVRIARGSGSEDPELPKRFQLPLLSTNGPTFLAQARAMATQAFTYRELFVRDGMPATFHDDLNKILGDYEAAVNGQFQGAALHIGARADMRAIAKELLQLVKRLDGIVLKLWESDPESKAAWQAARDVSWPEIKPSEGEPTPGGEGLKPAA